MADQDVPDGITLIPSSPPGGGGAAPEGITDLTPKNPQHGIFLNPGGDMPSGATNENFTPEPERGVQDFLLNRVPGSIGSFVGNTLHAAIHPIETGNALGNLIAGGFKIGARELGVDFPENESDQVARAFGHYVNNRYGSLDKAKEALYNDPVGVLADFSMVASGAGGIAKLATLGRTGEALATLGRVTNPAAILASPVTATISHFAPKLPAGGFDPATATFEGEEAAAAAPAAPKPSPQATQDAIRQRAYAIGQQRASGDPMSDWLQAEREIKNPTPAAPPPAPAAAAGNKIFQSVRSLLPYGAGAAGAAAFEMLAHHVAGAVAGGALSYGAVKLLPALLKSPAGQEMLARIGPGSNPAAVASVAKDLMPALNNLYKAQQQQPITVPSVFGRARGGMVNPELARIQRDRLRLPGIHEMLAQQKR